MDDATTVYVIEQQRYFEDLTQVAGQLAGLLVLAATGTKGDLPGHPMIEMASRTFREAAEGVRRGRPTPPAAQHHACLLAAADTLELALVAACDRMGKVRGGHDIAPVLEPLRLGYGHLQRASTLLPGFEPVSFGMGCCSAPRPTA